MLQEDFSSCKVKTGLIQSSSGIPGMKLFQEPGRKEMASWTPGIAVKMVKSSCS